MGSLNLQGKTRQHASKANVYQYKGYICDKKHHKYMIATNNNM